MQPTSLQDLESTLQKLESKKDEWANLTTLKRAELLRKTLACVLEVRAAPRDVEATFPSD